MNYERIYNELIEHRKMMPKMAGEYYERHHILPRCMGGSDEDENLVYLTAEDHFMAHMLLARAFGGVNWASANLMINGSQDKRKIKYRKSFGKIKEKFAEVMSDILRDKAVYEIYNIEECKFYNMTRKEICDRFGLNGDVVGRIVKSKRSFTNLCDRKYYETKLPWYDKQPLEFIHIRTQDVLKMTLTAFCITTGASRDLTIKLVTGKVKSTKGYTVPNVKLDSLKPNFDDTIYKIKNFVTGEIFEGNRSTLRKVTGISRNGLDSIVNRKQKFTQEWCLFDTIMEPKQYYKFFDMNTGNIIIGFPEKIREYFSMPYQNFRKIIAGRVKFTGDAVFLGTSTKPLHDIEKIILN